MYSICDKYIILFDYFAYIILIKVVGGDMQIYYLKSKSVDYVCEVCGIDSASVVSANNKEYVYIPNTSSGITKICNYPLDVLVSVDKDDNIEILKSEYQLKGDVEVGNKYLIKNTDKYIVKPLDTLDKICNRLGISKEYIMSKNNLKTDKLFIGQILLV